MYLYIRLEKSREISDSETFVTSIKITRYTRCYWHPYLDLSGQRAFVSVPATCAFTSIPIERFPDAMANGRPRA